MAKKSAGTKSARQPKIGDKVYVGEAYPNANDNIGTIAEMDTDNCMYRVTGSTTHALDGSEIKWNFNYPELAFITPTWSELDQRWDMSHHAPM